MDYRVIEYKEILHEAFAGLLADISRLITKNGILSLGQLRQGFFILCIYTIIIVITSKTRYTMEMEIKNYIFSGNSINDLLVKIDEDL